MNLILKFKSLWNMGLLKKNPRVSVIKPFGHETLMDFFDRVERELCERKYGEFVVLDCGEEVRVIADVHSTKESIYSCYSRIFIEGYQDRYERFLIKVGEYKNS